MTPEAEYRACLEFLYRLRPFGARLGLETTLKLAGLAGNPQGKLTFIHVAGTNGKGSTCAILESIYRHSGLRVGLFTSPHLTHFGERIQVNREFIPRDDVHRLINELKPLLQRFPTESHPTFFEVVTVLALRYFCEQKCDVVIWETGLGGRLDSTNIVTPAASVITSIGLDHQQWLGDTLPKIAAEKAGIIKRNVPVITGVDQPEAFEVISRIAGELNAPLTRVASGTEDASLDLTNFPLPGSCQRFNAALAVATTRIAASQIPVNDIGVKTGLESLSWPGRSELVRASPQKRYFLDGAHNPAAAQALTETLAEEFPGENAALILGVFVDKAIEPICRQLAPLSNRIFTVPIASQRTASATTLAGLCSEFHPAAQVTACDSLESALHQTRDQALVVITGSLYLVGQARELLGLTPGDHAVERALNEWNAGGPVGETQPRG